MRPALLPLLALLGLAGVASLATAAACDDLGWDRYTTDRMVHGDGGTLTVRVYGTAGCSYRVSTYAALDEPVLWIHAEQSSITLQGTDADAASFRFDANPGGPRRNHLLFEHASGMSLSPTVTQDKTCGYSVDLSVNFRRFGIEGGGAQINVYSGGSGATPCPEVVFATSDPWLHVGADGAFTVDPNDSGDRSGTILVSAPPRWSGESVGIYQAGVAAMDGGGNFESGDAVHDPLADALVNEEPGPEAALVLGALGLAAWLAVRRR